MHLACTLRLSGIFGAPLAAQKVGGVVPNGSLIEGCTAQSLLRLTAKLGRRVVASMVAFTRSRSVGEKRRMAAGPKVVANGRLIRK